VHGGRQLGSGGTGAGGGSWLSHGCMGKRRAGGDVWLGAPGSIGSTNWVDRWVQVMCMFKLEFNMFSFDVCLVLL
jgi:hypothetical protein